MEILGQFKDAASASSRKESALPQIFRVDAATASATFLRALRDNERVKPFTSDHDLATRLSHERRMIYAQRDPDDPDGALISVQVARTKGLANNIEAIIRAEDFVKGELDTATFYSISNWHRARGVGRTFLLAVVADIREQFPAIKHFATLSPIPNLRNWIRTLDEETLDAIGARRVLETPYSELDKLKQVLMDASHTEDLDYPMGLHSRDLIRLAVSCVSNGTWKGERFTSNDPGVAGFHLGNGGIAERLCINADRSLEGLDQSYGLMMNYRYDLDSLDKNMKAFRQGEPAQSEKMRQILTRADAITCATGLDLRL